MLLVPSSDFKFLSDLSVSRRDVLGPDPICSSVFRTLDSRSRSGEMLDHNEKVFVDPETTKRRAEDMIEQNKTSSSSSNEKKTCTDCGTSKTPLWRGGPAGPKSLCNACGIRNRKKRRGVEDKKHPNKLNSGGDLRRSPKLGESLKQRMMDFGMTKRSTVEKLGEEEQAAVLLMALSYGSVYA